MRRSGPLPPKRLRHGISDKHLHDVYASPPLKPDGAAAVDVEDAAICVAQLHAVSCRRQVRDADEWLLNVGYLKRDFASMPLGRAERHLRLAKVLSLIHI